MTTDAELRALAEAATPGPWRHSGATVWAPMSPDDPTDYSGEAVAYVPTLGDEFDADDAAYIAAASPDRILALLDEVARLEAALDYIARYDPGREDRWATVAHLQDYADAALLGKETK